MRFPAATLALLALLGPAPFAAAADNLADVYQQLKDAQTKKDPAAVKTLAKQLCSLARQAAAAPAPSDPEAKEGWAASVENAKGAELFSEYALYATAIQSPPATLVDLISTLEQQNPKSRYLDEGYGAYLLALSKTGAKPEPVAEKALANFPENEELLVFMVNTSLTRKQNDRAAAYAGRLITVLNKHTRPQTVSVADWDRKRSLSFAQGYWTIGVVNAEKGQYVVADKNLRAALPYIKGNDAMLAPALFHLGMANYQLGKMTVSKARVLEGAAFSEQCAAIDSPYADQARHNALVMKQEGQKMR